MPPPSEEYAPLAALLRPGKLIDIVGQSHLIAEGKPLRVAVERGRLFSMIFWGPPGSGKTSLARAMAKELDALWFELSAVSAGKADVKEVVEIAAEKKSTTQTILFLDEIHRFTKAQQDFLLPYVESGAIILIGATTENPSFSVIAPLLSRCRVFVLQSLSDSEMQEILERGEEKIEITLDEDAKEWLLRMSEGDARQMLGVLEQSVLLMPIVHGKRSNRLHIEDIKNAVQSKHLRYDKKGEEHYNTISAFIKSMRAGQPDAAVYYLSRMIDAGEDPLFIARRMVIFASEDVGNSQPTALVVANAVFQACQVIGYPECSIHLTQGAIYLASAKKSRQVVDALGASMQDVKEYGSLPIPLEVRNAPTKLMKELGYGKGYEKYSKKSFLPEKLKSKKYVNVEQEKD